MTDRIVSKRRRALIIAPAVFGLASQARAQARGIVMLVQINGPKIDVDRAAAAHLRLVYTNPGLLLVQHFRSRDRYVAS